MSQFYSGYTEIQTFDGPKWIKDIKVGDLVLTHKNRYKKVKSINKSLILDFNQEIFDLYFVFEDDVKIKEEGIHRIHESSKIILANGRSLEVSKIKPNMLLQLRRNQRGKVSSILKIPKENFPDFSYSIEIESDHSYYADNVCVND